jgi:RNA polymerase sigma-70 factor (ECF subfamily)
MIEFATECPPNRCSGMSEVGPLLSRDDFEVFAREYQDRLLAVASRFLRSNEDAADAVQDAFLSAYAARRTFQGQSTVYTWLYRIVMNTCLMKLRSAQLRKSRTYERTRSICQAIVPEPTDMTAMPASEAVEREELKSAVRSTIDRLPRDFREVLLLRDIEGLDTSETASRLRVSLETVKTRVHRARQTLRSMLKSICVGRVGE